MNTDSSAWIFQIKYIMGVLSVFFDFPIFVLELFKIHCKLNTIIQFLIKRWRHDEIKAEDQVTSDHLVLLYETVDNTPRLDYNLWWKKV